MYRHFGGIWKTMAIKLNKENFPISDEILALGKTINIPPLNDGIPDMVTQRALKEAADRYEQADIQWKESCKRKYLAEKENAGDHLYRLARGLLKSGAFFTESDLRAESKGNPNSDDLDAETP